VAANTTSRTSSSAGTYPSTSVVGASVFPSGADATTSFSGNSALASSNGDGASTVRRHLNRLGKHKSRHGDRIRQECSATEIKLESGVEESA
jgi:hypothetical protein